jgi:hypothetical protein
MEQLCLLQIPKNLLEETSSPMHQQPGKVMADTLLLRMNIMLTMRQTEAHFHLNPIKAAVV